LGANCASSSKIDCSVSNLASWSALSCLSFCWSSFNWEICLNFFVKILIRFWGSTSSSGGGVFSVWRGGTVFFFFFFFFWFFGWIVKPIGSFFSGCWGLLGVYFWGASSSFLIIVGVPEKFGWRYLAGADWLEEEEEDDDDDDDDELDDDDDDVVEVVEVVTSLFGKTPGKAGCHDVWYNS